MDGSEFAKVTLITTAAREPFSIVTVKPVVTVPPNKSTLRGLRHHLFNRPDLDGSYNEVMSYLAQLAPLIKYKAEKAMKSYGVEICAAGDFVTPLSWVSLQVRETRDTDITHDDGEESEAYDAAILFRIMWPIRLSRIVNSDYRTSMDARGAGVWRSLLPLGTPPRDVNWTIPQWVEEMNFERICSAYDAVWFLHPKAPFSKARLGSLGLRGRELNVLLSISAVLTKLGVTVQDASYWMWTQELADQFSSLEASNTHSYIYYAKAMGMCDSSPLAMNACPELFFLAHTVGLTCGLKRSEVAGYPRATSTRQTLLVASHMAYAMRGTIQNTPKWQNPAVEDRRGVRSVIELRNLDSTISTSGTAWYAYAMEGSRQEAADNALASIVSGYGTPRENSILGVLKTMLAP